MSVKECDHHGKERRKFFRRVFAAMSIFTVAILLAILVVWAILRPSKPIFILQDATIYSFNVSSPNLLTSEIQATVSSRNPNGKIGVYYDKLDIFAVYRNQQITLRTSIQPTYQGSKDITVWSPYLHGPAVSVALENAVALDQDRNSGKILLLIKVDASVRWKVGAFTSGKYNLFASCPATVLFGKSPAGIAAGDYAANNKLVQGCSVSV